MKTLTIKVPDELFAEIARTASARKVTKSEVVRERLIPRANHGAHAASSLWSQMEDLVIHSDTLPADLPSNKAHLKGYGKRRAH